MARSWFFGKNSTYVGHSNDGHHYSQDNQYVGHSIDDRHYNRDNQYIGHTNVNGEHFDSQNRYCGRTDPYTGYIYDKDNNFIGIKQDD